MLPEDPHGIVPVGWVFPGQYEVVCFPAPTGKSVLSLMVGVKYPSHAGDQPYTTTLDYITVLRDYLARTPPMRIFEAQYAWRQMKIAQFKLTGDDGE